MKRLFAALTGALVLSSGACQDNPAAPNTDRVVAGSPQTLQSLITGLVAQFRTTGGPTSAGSASPYFAYGDIMARDAIRPDPNETRWVTEFYETQPDPSDFIGGTQWAGYYTDLRAAHSLLQDPSVTKLTGANQAATRGFIHVMEGLNYTHLIEYHDQLGIAIQTDDPAAVPPIKTKQTALIAVSALLDTAITELTTAGGTQVPFVLPSGWTSHGDYTAAPSLLRLAQGLKGYMEVLRATDPVTPNTPSATTAITALNAALSDAPASPDQAYLDKGPWFEFNPKAPESFADPLVDLKLLLTDNFVASILPGDARASKIQATATQSATHYSASYRAPITNANNAANQLVPLPIMRNAELYLLRAQAEIVAGNLAAATADVNVVHTVEGGLPPLPVFTSVSQAQDAVLYEYRYSFILQGPQHLVALRSYGRLNAAYVSQPGMPTPGAGADALVQVLPIPKAEVDARKGNVTPVP